MKASIEKIVFNVRGKKFELTKEEAKELKLILGDLFGETKVVHEYHTWPYQWSYPTTYTGVSTGISNMTSDTVCLDSSYGN